MRINPLYICFLLLPLQLRAERIIVHGTLLELSEFETPSSMNVFDQKDFERTQSSHLEDLLPFIPGLSSAKGSSRPRFFQIRGIGERSSYVGMPNHSVGVLIDEIDYSGIGGVLDFMGLERLEVFRGPQAARFGPNALAGMIVATSKGPGKKEQALEMELGSFDKARLGASLMAPSWAFHSSFQQTDGYIKNSYLLSDETNNQREFSVKTKGAKDFEQGHLEVTLHRFDHKNGYDAFSYDNSLTTISDRPGRDDQLTQAIALKWKTKNTQSILTALDHQSLYSYDEDWGNDASYDYDISFTKKRRALSFEYRYWLRPFWVAGVSLREQKERSTELARKEAELRRDLQSEFTTENLAVFTQTENALSEKWSVLSSARLEWRGAEYSDSQSMYFAPTEVMWGAELALQYHLSLQGLLYTKLSRGFKGGGFNTQSSLDPIRRQYKAESLHTLEFGHKNNFSESFSFSHAAFIYQRDDIQIQTSFQDDPLDPSSYTFYTDNATGGLGYGYEVQIHFEWDQKISAGLGMSLLRTRFDEFHYADKSLKGRDFAHAPRYSGGAHLRWWIQGPFYWQSSVELKDEFYFSSSHEQRSNATQVFNTAIGIEGKKGYLELYVKNLFNEVEQQRGYFFSNEPPLWEEKLYVQRGAPRHFGVKARWSF